MAQEVKRVHFAGVAGVFMCGLAALAKEAGYEVSGSDAAFYPPGGDIARALNIELYESYEAAAKQARADLYVVGNALSRGNALAEKILNEGAHYVSGPQWLRENVLRGRKVIAVAGTHGKTTTASLLIHILQVASMSPGFVLGGAMNGGACARLGEGEWFVVEADEYDSAFFDKRPKFLHYRPQIAVINNLEFDHADIYGNVGDIIRQFHYLLRSVPGNGAVVANANCENTGAALTMGVYSPLVKFNDSAEWHCRFDNGEMTIARGDEDKCSFIPPLAGAANRGNILAAAAAAQCAGVDCSQTAQHLKDYKPPQRRLQVVGDIGGIMVIDDFAHHPTAYRATISALQEKYPGRRVLAVFEPRSNTMKAGVFVDSLADSLRAADLIFGCAAGLKWNLHESLSVLKPRASVAKTIDELCAQVSEAAREGDCVLLMSNGSFNGAAQKIMSLLRGK